MAQNKIQMPGAFGGLMRYDEEYQSRFMLSPSQIVGFIIAIIVLVLILKVFFPISSSPAPVPTPGFILSLLTNFL